jgi:hypothetical protein
MSKQKSKEHRVQIISKDVRYIAVELEGKITFTRDGAPAGRATWRDDQFLENSALLPDDVILQMERLIKEAIAADYFD